MVAEGVVVAIGDDEVVEEGDAEDVAGLPDFICQGYVLWGWGETAGWVVVEDHD